MSSDLLAGLCLAWALPPSTAVDDHAFDPRAYWRGPQWPPMTWLVWWALDRVGHRQALGRGVVVPDRQYRLPLAAEGMARAAAGKLDRPEILRAADERRRRSPGNEQPARRATLIAARTAPGNYRFDIRLQGDGETVFFDI